MDDKIINTPQLIMQIVLERTGHMLATYLANDTYYEVKAVNALVRWLSEEMGEDYIEKELAKIGKDWKKINKAIQQISQNATKAKRYYDLIEDKKFANLKKDVKFKNEFLKYSGKIPLFDSPVTFMYIWCVKRTSLQNAKVRPEAMKRLEDTGFMKTVVRKQTQGDFNPIN